MAEPWGLHDFHLYSISCQNQSFLGCHWLQTKLPVHLRSYWLTSTHYNYLGELDSFVQIHSWELNKKFYLVEWRSQVKPWVNAYCLTRVWPMPQSHRHGKAFLRWGSERYQSLPVAQMWILTVCRICSPLLSLPSPRIFSLNCSLTETVPTEMSSACCLDHL